jgi:hypothetical protein
MMWIFALIFDVFVALLGGPVEALWTDDLKNRNDRGKLRRPSSKYIC